MCVGFGAGFSRLKCKCPLEMAHKLPPSLQPTVRPFDADNVDNWFRHVKRVYEAYDIKNNAVIPYVGQFLPQHLQPIHEKLLDKSWEEYVKTLLEYTQTENSCMPVRMRMLQMSKNPSESTIDFILRVNALAANDDGLQEKEKVKILMEIIPEEDAELLVSAGCLTVKDLISTLSDTLQNIKLVRKRKGGANTSDIANRVDQLEKLIQEKIAPQKTEGLENKILALLENFEKPKEKSLEEKSLEEKLLEKIEALSLAAKEQEPTTEQKIKQIWAVVSGQEDEWYEDEEYGEDYDGDYDYNFQGNQEYQNNGEFSHGRQQAPHFDHSDDQGWYAQGQWRGHRRGACFRCNSLDHQIAQCPNFFQ